MPANRPPLALLTALTLAAAGPAAALARVAEENTVTIHHLPVEGELTVAWEDLGGTGPLVVALPGMGDLRSEYRFLGHKLVEAGHHVVLMDLRGHGASSVGFRDHTPEAIGRDALALVEHLGEGPAILVGASYAAAAAVDAAADQPGLVSALVLLGPAVLDHPPPLHMKAAMGVLFGGPWRVSSWLWWVDKLFPTARAPDHADHRADLEASLKEPGRFEALAAMLAEGRTRVEAKLPKVKVPALVVMGTKDADFPDPAAEAKLVAEKLRARHVLIAGAGHYPHVEMPEEAARPILDFLAEQKR